jgi:hypothetical protein
MSSSPPRGRLSQTPKLSPSSPKRRPLHQRSDSEANAPSIRIVADDSPSVYTKSPFPSHPSQILQPRYAPFGQGLRVSDENTPTNNASAKNTKREALVPGPLQPRKLNRASTSTTTSDPDTSFENGAPFSSSSSRFSAGTSPPSSPIEEDFHRVDPKLTPVREELVPGPATIRPTIRAVLPSSANDLASVANKQSETSLASSASSDIPLGQSDGARRRSSASSNNYVVFPHSSSSSLPADKRTSQDASSPPRPIPNYSSVDSIAFSDASYSSNAERPRSASHPANPSHAGLREAYKSGARVQFPAIRAPSATGSFAEVSRSGEKLKPTPRMNDGSYRPPPWSSRLSTIASESTERTSQSLSSGGQYFPRRRRTIGSVTSDGQATASEEQDSIFEEGSGVLTGSESNVSIPYPPALFSSSRPLPPIPGDDGQGRDSEEGDDTVGELQSPQVLRPQRSGFLSRFTSRSRPGSSDSTQSHASQISFIGDLSWAKYGPLIHMIKFRDIKPDC